MAVQAGGTSRRRIPEATVARLPLYYRALVETGERQVATISSERLAELAGVNAAKVRKDLSYLGSYGTRGVGYDVEYLLHEISRELGLTRDWPVAIVGIGNLGRALANYRGFGARGFRVVALIDAEPTIVGKRIGDLAVESLHDLDAIVADRGIAIGILAVPAAAAQDVCDRLVAAGVTSILNFAPAVCTVPEGVSMRKVDLAIELQILSFYQLRRGVPAGRASSERPRRVSPDCPQTCSYAAARWWWSAVAVSPPARSARCSNSAPRSRSWRARSATRSAASRPTAGSPWSSGSFDPSDIDGAWLAFTATDDPAINAAVHAAGEAAHIWVNSADDPANCSFTLMSVVRRSDLVVSVGTGGRSPALAAHLRRAARTGART